MKKQLRQIGMRNAQEPTALFSFDHQIELAFDRRTIVPCVVAVYRPEVLPADTIKIGFFGGAGEPDLSNNSGIGITQQSLDFARRTGHYIGIYNQNKDNAPKILPVTGAPPGNPHAFAEAAAEMGTFPIGISPFYDEEQHIQNGSHTGVYAVIVYMGQDRHANFDSVRGKERVNLQFALRDGYNILGIHAGIYCGGSLGTLQELVANLQLGKDLALAKGTDGIADKFPDFYRGVGKDTGSEMVISADPEYIVRRLIELQERRKQRNGKRQKLFIDDIVLRVNEENKRRK